MDDPLIKEVQEGLAAHKGNWRQIASEIPGVSYSWISRMGSGSYDSEPGLSRLRKVAEYLRALKKKRKH